MIALGLRLQANGHKVRLAAPEKFEGFVHQWKLDYFPIRYDIKILFQSKAGQAMLKSGNSQIKTLINSGKLNSPIISQLGNDCCSTLSPYTTFSISFFSNSI